MYRIVQDGFMDGRGVKTSFLDLSKLSSASADWEHMQQESLQEYVHHAESTPSDVDVLYSLFGGYIARMIYGRMGLRILDVGCGVRHDIPPYAAFLGAHGDQNMYIGLDPIPHNVEGRNYNFICGRLEDIPRVLESKFNVFLFSTSLDHFEKLEDVAAAISLLSTENAVCIAWVGVHDANVVAEQTGALRFRRLFDSLKPLSFFNQAMRLAASLPRTYVALAKRAARLRRGEPLDNLHFHYFTRDGLLESMKLFGRPRDMMQIPGTNSVFVTVDLSGVPPR